MGFVLVRDLNDVFVRSRIDDLENIGSRGQYLGARAPNFDWRAKRYDRLSVEIVGLGFRRDEYTEHGEAQSRSKTFEHCHLFLHYFLRLTNTAVIMRPLYVVGFTRVRTPETPAASIPWRELNASITCHSINS
jgi:hypothetical protein